MIQLVVGFQLLDRQALGDCSSVGKMQGHNQTAIVGTLINESWIELHHDWHHCSLIPRSRSRKGRDNNR
jgi:hypothetical protein